MRNVGRTALENAGSAKEEGQGIAYKGGKGHSGCDKGRVDVDEICKALFEERTKNNSSNYESTNNLPNSSKCT